MLDPFVPPVFVEPAQQVSSLPFTSVGDLFTFIGLLVAIGSIGVYALYRIWKEFVCGD